MAGKSKSTDKKRKPARKAKAKTPRVPVEAVRKLGSRPIESKKGAKGYTRRKAKREAGEMIGEETEGRK